MEYVSTSTDPWREVGVEVGRVLEGSGILPLSGESPGGRAWRKAQTRPFQGIYRIHTQSLVHANIDELDEPFEPCHLLNIYITPKMELFRTENV